MGNVVIFLAGVVLSGAGSYMVFDSRITRVETTVDNAHLAEIPARLASIETLLLQREKETAK